MKKNLLFCLVIAMMFTFMACSNNSDSDKNPESMATLYLMVGGEENGQYELGYTGELTPSILLDGLTSLTGYNFSYDDFDISNSGLTGVTVYWSDKASFLSDKEVTPNKDLDLKFYDFDSELQFMLDSTYATLKNNLKVGAIYFALQDYSPLDFQEEANWSLNPAEAYSGNFSDYYSDYHESIGDDYIFLDERENPSDEEDNISPEEAADGVFNSLVTNYEGEINPDVPWYIILKRIDNVNGSEGYGFSVGQENEHKFVEYFYAIITYDRNIYILENNATEYIEYGTLVKE